LFFYLIFEIFVAVELQTPTNPPATPVSLSPTAPATSCAISHTFGFDITTIISKDVSYAAGGNENATLLYSLCDATHTGCGEQGEICYNQASCCGLCYSWTPQGDTPNGACLGRFAGVSLNMVSGEIQLNYAGGDPTGGNGRQAVVFIGCGGGVAPEVSSFNSNPPINNGMYTYPLHVTTSIVCTGGTLGFGGIMLIILVVTAVVYLVGGIVYNKVINPSETSSGSIVESLPNYEFWMETPSLFLAGVQFSKSKIFGLMGREEYSSL